MRAELYRLFSLLLILIMLFTIQPAAWAEEDILFEEPVELPVPVPETEVMEEILPDPEETAADDEEQETEHELRIDNTEAFMAAEENAGGSVRFSGRGLLLSNRIGLAFYLDVPEAYREGSFVRFDGKGVAQSCEIPDAPDEHGLYRFVCWLSPLELARRVTPTFCRGELSVPGEPYAVRDFIEAAGEDDERRALLTGFEQDLGAKGTFNGFTKHLRDNGIVSFSIDEHPTLQRMSIYINDDLNSAQIKRVTNIIAKAAPAHLNVMLFFFDGTQITI